VLGVGFGGGDLPELHGHLLSRLGDEQGMYGSLGGSFGPLSNGIYGPSLWSRTTATRHSASVVMSV
jgi:hypothetical protein